MKNILLVGGMGKIGKVLREGLPSYYWISVADVCGRPEDFSGPHFQVDASEFNALSTAVQGDFDVLVNLAGMDYQPDLVDAPTFLQMASVYLNCSYNSLLLAKERGIARVVLASSNHVTDHCEKEGKSLLGREITESDYPLSDGVYGSLKLYAEALGHAFAVNTDVSVICLRIGSVVLDERKSLLENPRFRHTLLSHEDTTELFRCAFEADVGFGVYYGVSDNPGRPWSLARTISELGFKPRQSAADILGE